MSEPWPPIEEGWEHRSEPEHPYGPYAGFGVRFVGWIIDSFAAGFIAQVLLSITGNFGKDTDGIWDIRWSGFLITVAIGIAYSAFFIGSTSGQTPGMRVMRIRAIDIHTGGRVDYGRCVTRYVIGQLSGLLLGLGYLWMLWDPYRQTWHDRAAGTVIVPVEAYPVERWPG